MTIDKYKAVIALGTSVYNSDITQKEITIPQLFKQLKQPTVQTKKDGRYFIFASFKSSTRSAINVKEYYGATVDLDDTSLTLKQIKKQFAKYQYCIYTTFNHKAPDKGDRYRLVLPYKKPVSAASHVNAMLYIMDMLGAENVDLSSKALSRPMYLPAYPKTRSRHFECISNTKGLLFNPTSDKIKESIATLQFKQHELDESVIEVFDVNRDVEEGDRNNAMARAIGKFIKTGVAVDQLLPMAVAWNDTKLSPPLTKKEVKTTLKSIVNAHKRNHNDLQWGYDEIVSRIKKSKDIISEYDHILDIVVTAKSKDKLKKSQIELLINALNQKSKVGKRVIQQEIITKELELAGKQEEQADASFENTAKALKYDLKDWVYVASNDKIYNTKTGEFYKKEAFSAMFAPPSVDGSFLNLIFKYDIISKVSRLEFDPAQPEIYVRDNIKYANTYIYPEIFPIPGDITPILDHFTYLIPERYERKIFLDFIAHLVQKPGTKIRWMPIIKGGKGIGKTIIAEKIILPIIGFVNFGKVSNDLIKSDFNSWQLDKQLVVFEELDIGANQKEKEQLTDRLKSFITDNIMTAHRKGVDPYDTINKANSLGFTNKEDAIIITQDERRFCLIRSDVKPKPNGYYQKLAKFADNHLQEIYYFFLERKIGKFSSLTAPETAYTKEVKKLSMGWPASIISSWIGDDEHPATSIGAMSYKQLVDFVRAESSGKYRSFADDLQNPGSAQSKQLNNTLRNFGFERYINTKRIDGRLMVNKRLENVWLFPDSKLKKSTPKALIKRIETIKITDENWDDG